MPNESPKEGKAKGGGDETVGGRVPILPTDVIGGRGRYNLQNQIGNDKFEDLVRLYAPQHQSGGGSMAMPKIHVAIMAQLPESSRFMTDYDRASNTAIELTPRAARIKIGQAIRYQNSPKHRRIVAQNQILLQSVEGAEQSTHYSNGDHSKMPEVSGETQTKGDGRNFFKAEVSPITLNSIARCPQVGLMLSSLNYFELYVLTH